MKRKIVLLFICLLLFGCENKIDIKVSSLNYNEVKELMSSQQDFMIYVGRSDCPDCILFKEHLENNIKVPSDIKFVEFDIKEYRDNSVKENANDKDVKLYEDIKHTFDLKWVPTIYTIKDGKIVSQFQYLDETYHSYDKEKQKEIKNSFDKLSKQYIERGY